MWYYYLHNMNIESTINHPVLSQHRNKHILYILLSVIVFLSVVYVVMIRKDRIEPYSIDARYMELSRLKNTGAPVSTTEERYEVISNSEGSGTVQISTFEKLKAMDALNQN